MPDDQLLSATLPIEAVVNPSSSLKYQSVEKRSQSEIVSGLRMIASGLGMVIAAYIRMNGLKDG